MYGVMPFKPHQMWEEMIWLQNLEKCSLWHINMLERWNDSYKLSLDEILWKLDFTFEDKISSVYKVMAFWHFKETRW